MATPLQDYERRIKQTLEGKTRFDINTAAEAQLALRQIVQLQKELRQIKKEIGLTIKSLRAQYADQKEGVSKAGFGKGVMQGVFGKKSVARMDAAQKDRIRQNQNKQLAPYEALQSNIDRFILEYDGQKVKLDAWVSQQSK